MDVGGFAEPRKILCQCALPSYEQVSVHPRSAHGGAGIPQQCTLERTSIQLLNMIPKWIILSNHFHTLSPLTLQIQINIV